MPSIDGNLFRCRVRNRFGQQFSNSAQLTVINASYLNIPNTILGDPSDLYADIIEAQAAIDNQTAEGYFYEQRFDPTEKTIILFSGSAVTTGIAIDEQANFIASSHIQSAIYFKFTANQAMTINVTGNISSSAGTSGAGNARLLDSIGGVVDSVSSAGVSPINVIGVLTVPGPGDYYLSLGSGFVDDVVPANLVVSWVCPFSVEVPAIFLVRANYPGGSIIA